MTSGFKEHHFTPYARRCMFSEIDYDDVIRIETYRHDVEPLLTYTQSNISALLDASKPHYRRITRAQNSFLNQTSVLPEVLTDFANISPASLNKLKRWYRYNLEFFGYDFDVETRTAMCKLTDAEGNVCC